MKIIRVLVCGGRNYTNRTHVFSILDSLVNTTDPGTAIHVIHGGAEGADALGQEWALATKKPCFEFPANWQKYGKGAGAIRNQQMIDEGHPDLVIAFPGGKGTTDMIRRAQKAGINVISIQEPNPPAL